MKKLICVLSFCAVAAAHGFESEAIKHAADATGLAPSEVRSRVGFAASPVVSPVDGASSAAIAAAARAAGVNLSALPSTVRISRWDLPIPEPTSAELAAVEDASVVSEPDENMEYVGNKWRRKSAAALEAIRQSKKPAGLKAAERKLVKFLRDEGAIAADAVSATPEQIDAMYETWEATLKDNQLEKKSSKYTRLLERVERAGGTEADAYYHAD